MQTKFHMIELVSSDRCIKCGICAKICPTNVFGPELIPSIARQEDCQTCFACEAYCPADAIYVSPYNYPKQVDEKELVNDNQLGLYRKMLGWKKAGQNIKKRILVTKLIEFSFINLLSKEQLFRIKNYFKK